jgi:hypothetical protein
LFNSYSLSIQTGQPQNLLHVQCRKHCSVRDRLLLVLTRTSSRVDSPPLKRSGQGVPPRGETSGSPDSNTENQPKKIWVHQNNKKTLVCRCEKCVVIVRQKSFLVKLIFLIRIRFLDESYTFYSHVSIGTELSVYCMAVLRGLTASIFCQFSLHT